MHALVLAAGLGVRLRPLTTVRAKPAIPVAGEPLIRRIIRTLRAQGISDVVINLHHLPHTLTASVGDGSDLGVSVRYSWESPEVLGSAGGPRQALSILGPDDLFIVNGDTLTDVDLARLASAHKSSGAVVTLALAPNHDPQHYGGVRLDAGGRVTGFVPRGSAEPSLHFLGVQLAAARAFDAAPAGVPINSIGGIYDDLIRSSPGSIHGFVCDARFWDVGTLSDYWNTCEAFNRAEGRRDNFEGRHAMIDPSARVTRSILWDAVVVGAGAQLDECIVTDGVHIPAGSTFRRTALVTGPGGHGLLTASF